MDNVSKIEKKLQYSFGKATGTKHSTDRSIGMLRELEKIGLSDTPATRQYLAQFLSKTYANPASIASIQKNGNVVRKSLLMGPQGGTMLETYWDSNRLISGKTIGPAGRFHHQVPPGHKVLPGE